MRNQISRTRGEIQRLPKESHNKYNKREGESYNDYLERINSPIKDNIATEEEILRNPGLRTVNEYKLSFGCQKVSNYIYESFLYRLMHRVALLTGVIKSNDELQEDDKKD